LFVFVLFLILFFSLIGHVRISIVGDVMKILLFTTTHDHVVTKHIRPFVDRKLEENMLCSLLLVIGRERDGSRIYWRNYLKWFGVSNTRAPKAGALQEVRHGPYRKINISL